MVKRENFQFLHPSWNFSYKKHNGQLVIIIRTAFIAFDGLYSFLVFAYCWKIRLLKDLYKVLNVESVKEKKFPYEAPVI